MAAPNLRVKILHFVAGQTMLGGRQSVSTEPGHGLGVEPVSAIKRIPGGYLVGYGKKLFMLPDSQILIVEVEDLDAEDAPVETPKPVVAAAPALPARPMITAHEAAALAAKEDRARLAAERAAAAGAK